MTYEQLDALTTRELRIEKFKIATWGPRLESYFFSYKSKLDKVIYSLIRTQDLEVVTEVYFRLKAGEQSFAECAQEYSLGEEAQTGGLLGPVELSVPHPTLAKMLSISQPGQLWPPTRLGEWLVIVRLEKFIPAQLNEPMRQQLLNGLLEAWLNEQMKQGNREIRRLSCGEIERLGEAPHHPITESPLSSPTPEETSKHPITESHQSAMLTAR